MKKDFNLLCLPSVDNVSQIVNKFSFPINLTKGKFQDLDFIIQKGKIRVLNNGVDLNRYSFIWLSSFWKNRDLAYAVKLYLEQSDVPCTYVEKSTSKVTDHMIFALDEIQVPDTLFFTHPNIIKKLSIIKEVCGYPLIIKDTKGSKGALSEYIASEEELINKMKKLPKHRKFLFQKFIPNEYDWGVMVANGTVVSGEKSYPAEGEFRNNTCNGAEEIFVDPNDIPKEIQEMAMKTSSLLGLSWSRADIIIDKETKKPYLLEVNRCPGITANTTEVDGGYQFLSAQIKQTI